MNSHILFSFYSVLLLPMVTINADQFGDERTTEKFIDYSGASNKEIHWTETPMTGNKGIARALCLINHYSDQDSWWNNTVRGEIIKTTVKVFPEELDKDADILCCTLVDGKKLYYTASAHDLPNNKHLLQHVIKNAEGEFVLVTNDTSRSLKWTEEKIFEGLLTWLCAKAMGFGNSGFLISNKIDQETPLNLGPRGGLVNVDSVTCDMQFTAADGVHIEHHQFTGIISPISDFDLWGVVVEHTTEYSYNILKSLKKQQQDQMKRIFTMAIRTMKAAALAEIIARDEQQQLKRNGDNHSSQTKAAQKWNPDIFIDWIKHFRYNDEENLMELCRAHNAYSQYLKIVHIDLELSPISSNIKTNAIVCSAGSYVKEPFTAVFSPIASQPLFIVEPIINQLSMYGFVVAH